MDSTNYTYIRNTSLDISSLQEPVFSILLSGRDVAVYADTTDGNIITELSPSEWRQAATTTLIINNPSGANNINLVSTLINDARTRNWALQRALELTTAGASVIVHLIRYGGGTATISINGVQVMNSTELVGYVLIQATDVDFYQETNLITPVSGGNTQYVTLGTNQTITGIKTFSAPPIINTIKNGAGTLTLPTTTGTVALLSDIPSTATFVDLSTTQTIGGVKTFTNSPVISTITNGGTLTLPTTSGTLALLSDIPSPSTYVTISGTQTITGSKTFTGSTVFSQSGNLNPSLGSLYVNPNTTTIFGFSPSNIFFTSFNSPTMSINSGTVSSASTLYIEGPPTQISGTGSLTNAYSLNVGGPSLFRGPLILGTFPNITTLATSGTGIKTITFPATAGTLALTSDIPSPSNVVDLTTNQTIGGIKTFTSKVAITATSNQIDLGASPNITTLTTSGTGNKTITFPATGGTLALTTDIPSNVVNLTTNQTIGGIKTFTSKVAITATSNQIDLGASPNITTITSPTPSGSRTYTIPDVGTNANFMMTNSTSGQSVSGQVISPPTVITTNTALTIASSKFIVANPSSNVTITLPSSPINGMEFIILNRSIYILNVNTGQATDYFNNDSVTQTSVLTFNDRIHIIYYSSGWYTI